MTDMTLPTCKHLRRFHLILLVAGGLFLLSGAFQESLWFDETYSIALTRHSLSEMCSIAANDVHPVLYYIYLWLFARLPGGVITLRIASVIPAVLLAALGYTHLRRDFGEVVGFWFSALIFLLPCTLRYALQIRMYSLAALLVAIAAIYARRFYLAWDKPLGGRLKNLCLFAAASVGAAYTHHFAMGVIGMMNIFLLVAFFAHRKRDSKGLWLWLAAFAVQLLSYVPGAMLFFRQIKTMDVSGNRIDWWTVIPDTCAFPLLGDMKGEIPNPSRGLSIAITVITVIAFLLWLCILGTLFRTCLQKRKDSRAAVFSLLLFACTVFASLAVSVVRPIYLERDTMVMYSLAVFPGAYALSHAFRPYSADEGVQKDRSYLLRGVMAALLLCVLCVRAVPMFTEMYAPSNRWMRDYLSEQMQEGDRLVFDDIMGYNTAIYFPEVRSCFYNSRFWDIEDAYLAYSNTVVERDPWGMDEYAECIGRYAWEENPEDEQSRVWVLGGWGPAYQQLTEEYGYREVSRYPCNQEYYGYQYEVILLVKP